MGVQSSKAREAEPKLFVAWLDRHYISMVAIFVLLVYMLTYLARPFGDPIRADGAGYYAYLPSLLLYGDPSFETDANAHYGGAFPTWTYVRRYPPTGRYLNALNIGVSLMASPFFLVAHTLTWWFGWPWEDGPAWMKMRFPPDGYSLFYQHGAGLAGVFYFLLGFAILKNLLGKVFPRGVVLFTLTALLLGTNLLFYSASDTVNAHAYTFFLTALLMWLTSKWYEQPASWRWGAGLGTVLALLVLVRPLNFFLWLWFPLYGMRNHRDAAARVRVYGRNWRTLVVAAVVASAWMIPQMLLWKAASGHFIVRAYQHMDVSSFGAPHLLGVLFGAHKGLFIWFPLFLFVVLGSFFMKEKAAPLRLPWLGLFTGYLLIISMYRIWTSAGGFGNRYVVDLVFPAAFPLASLFETAFRSRWKWFIGLATMACILWVVFLLTLQYRREIGWEGTDIKGLLDVFWWRKELIINVLHSLR